MILQDELPLTAQNRIKGLILLREQVRELIDFQMIVVISYYAHLKR